MTVETVAPVLRSVTVECTPEHAFRVFTEQVGDWWPLEKYSIYGEDVAGAWFEPGADGRIVERSKAGDESNWGEILIWEPPTRVAFTWHPGSAPDEPSTEVELRFIAVGDATRVELEHRGWEALAKPEETRNGYDQGWPAVLEHYAAAAGA
jgi:uncharacterized protein YndB with AHSA1/START domain